MTRVFVAVWPDESVAAELARLPRREEPGVRWMPPESWHVTLRFVGTADVRAVCELLDGARLPRLTARLGPAVESIGRAAVVPVAGVEPLAAAVLAATRAVGEDAEQPFRGHVTVARTKRGVRPPLIGTAITASMVVDAVRVVTSELTADGAIYRTARSFATSA
jgi:RNA 2',3'-cyclic 3'-phosphodiesterase